VVRRHAIGCRGEPWPKINTQTDPANPRPAAKPHTVCRRGASLLLLSFAAHPRQTTLAVAAPTNRRPIPFAVAVAIAIAIAIAATPKSQQRPTVAPSSSVATALG